MPSIDSAHAICEIYGGPHAEGVVPRKCERTMHAVFVACLVGGAVATALSVLLSAAGGASHGHAGPGGHAHAAHAQAQAHGSLAGRNGSTHSAAHVGGTGRLSFAAGWTLSWFSPLTLAAAALWFGGIGLIAEGNQFALILAVLAALAGAALIRGVFGALIRAGTAPLSSTAEGAIATVNATIRPDGLGEVIYTLEGLHRSVAAQSEDGLVIPRGTSVVITRRERGIAWVEPLEPLDNTSHLEERNG